MKLAETQIIQALMKARTRLSAAAWMVVRDTHAAEDLFQNLALKAMTREVSFESEAALLSWAFITARREGIDWLRRHQRETVGLDLDILELLENEWLTAASFSPGAKMEALQDCLAAAPESARRLLTLRYFDGYDCEEVAREMGIALNAVYKRLSRLHESLRECIEGKLARTRETP
jgi:RNA polymerase sigma-70 factor (ECF subfamily)